MHNLSSDLSDRSNERWKTPYIEIIAVGTIQFFLNLPILCYGVFLMQFVLKESYPLKDSLWTAIAFVGAYKITNPWTKSYCKRLQLLRCKVYKRNITIFAILLCLNLVFLAFDQTPISTIIFYGIFGGTFSSIISVHLNFLTAEAFKHHPQLFVILDTLTKSFCLLIMPHLILFLINFYGTRQTLIIIAVTSFNIVPACFLVKNRRYEVVELCRFQTSNLLSVEMVDLTRPAQQDLSSSSEEEDEEHQEEEVQIQVEKSDDEELQPEVSTNVQKYYQNVGVKILPDIAEESDYEEDDDINEISSKRLSRISAVLQEINVSKPRRDSNLSVINLYQPEETIETVYETVPESEEPVSESVGIEKSVCCSINSNIISNLKLKKRILKSFCFRQFLKPVPRTLKTLYFYPALVSSSITTILSTIIFATAPYLMYLNNEQNTPEESTFLLTIIGFTWLFFLAGYPVFNKFSSFKTKILFLVGLSILGLSLFIVHRFKYDNFVLFSLTFGLGHGIITYAEDIANENFFGESKWKMLKGALEICTGFIVILIYLVIYYSYLDIYTVLFYAYWLYVFDVVLWIAAYIIKKIYVFCRNARQYILER